MITIPLYVALIIYLTYLIIVISFFLINLSHLISNGALTLISFLFNCLIGFAVISILYFTIYLLKDVVWTQPMTIWNSDWITGVLNPSNF